MDTATSRTKTKENGHRFERNSGRSVSNRSVTGNQVIVVEFRLGDILTLEASSIGEVVYSPQDAQIWLLDSSATFYVTPNIKWFSKYSGGANSAIQLRNKQKYVIVGIGEVPIQLLNNNTITLHRVQHVPELKRSLVSISMLVEVGY